MNYIVTKKEDSYICEKFITPIGKIVTCTYIPEKSEEKIKNYNLENENNLAKLLSFTEKFKNASTLAEKQAYEKAIQKLGKKRQKKIYPKHITAKFRVVGHTDNCTVVQPFNPKKFTQFT